MTFISRDSVAWQANKSKSSLRKSSLISTSYHPQRDIRDDGRAHTMHSRRVGTLHAPCDALTPLSSCPRGVLLGLLDDASIVLVSPCSAARGMRPARAGVQTRGSRKVHVAGKTAPGDHDTARTMRPLGLLDTRGGSRRTPATSGRRASFVASTARPAARPRERYEAGSQRGWT